MDNNFIKLKLEEILLYSLEFDKEKTLSYLSDIISSSSNRTQFILESNLDLINSVADMCKFTQLTANTLRKHIQQIDGTNPKKWLDNKRLQRASLLLKNTDKSIEQIATDCGYASVSWFISKFKEKFNTTPKDFRYKS